LRPESGDAQSAEPRPHARDPLERLQTGSPVSDVVHATRHGPDLHLAALHSGRDLGQTVATAAHAASGGTAPALGAAPVPLDALAVEIAARANAGRSRFEIRLDPPELGRIEVRLDIDRSGQVTSRLVVERADTLDVLRRDAHQLERALQDAGLKTADSGLQFALRDQGFAGRQDNHASGAPQSPLSDTDRPVADGTPVTYGLTLRGNGGVDIRI
jgi:hypothetical protein